MQENIIKTRCTQGWLILDEQGLHIEGPRVNQSLSRGLITNYRTRQEVPSIFGMGGGVELTVQERGGNTLQANMVKPKDAEKIIAELQGKGGK